MTEHNRLNDINVMGAQEKSEELRGPAGEDMQVRRWDDFFLKTKRQEITDSRTGAVVHDEICRALVRLRISAGGLSI